MKAVHFSKTDKDCSGPGAPSGKGGYAFDDGNGFGGGWELLSRGNGWGDGYGDAFGRGTGAGDGDRKGGGQRGEACDV